MTSITSIILNLSAVNSAVTVYAKQNDRLARKITATLFDGSAAWTPPIGAVAVIRYKKPDGTVGFYDTDENGDPATSISGNVVTLTIAEQALTVPGDVWMELNFYNLGDEKLTTFYFLIKVQQSVLDDGTIISSDYFNALTALYSQISAIAADLPVPSTDTPLADVAGGAVGTAANFARGDHRHPIPTADAVAALALDGHSVEVNVVSNLNNFVSGLAVFQPSTTNTPFAAWGFVVSAGDSNTRMQVAYSFDATVPPKRRDLSGGTWSAWKYIKGVAYNPGDVFDSTTKYIVMNGYITGSMQDLFLDLTLPASVDYVTSATVDSMIGTLRGVKGYLNSDASEVDIKSSYNVTVNYLSGNHIRIDVTNTSGFTNVDNNTPVAVYAKIKVTFS